MFFFALFFITVMSLCSYYVTWFYFAGFVKNAKSVRMRLLKCGISLGVAVLSYFVRVIALGLMHMALFLAVSMGIRALVRLVKRRPGERVVRVFDMIYKCAAIPLVCILAMFIAGRINIGSVQATQYVVKSPELRENYRVVFISDIHYATVQDASVLAEKLAEINAQNPDLVILGGDIVEEGTDADEMRECFSILGDIESTYGTYFVYGNHDRQRYSMDPSYTEEELVDVIESNGITILREEYVVINDDFVLFGREDKSAVEDRLPAEVALRDVSPDRFILTADHQPNSTTEEDAAIGTDLMVSGHTHGGQIFPLAWMPFLYGGFVYGEYTVDEMTVLVSSGFSGWGFPVRTQGVSEYVVIDLITDREDA